jgi:SPP1 gp7 family putative phage head morphogenesis protein
MSLAFERGLTAKLRREFKKTASIAAEQARTAHHVDITGGHLSRLQSIIRPYVRSAFRAFYLRLALEAGTKAAPAVLERKWTEDELNQEMENYIRQVTFARLGDVSKTTGKRIADAIADGHKEGLTWDAIADRIVETTSGDIGDARARTIARTEMHSASQAGSIAAAEDLNIPGLRKQWTAVSDERTRPDHVDADGQIVDMDEPFEVGGESLDYPGDPAGSPENTINCRCVTTYTTDKE